MKRLILLSLVLAALVSLAAAQAEPEALTRTELTAWREQVLKDSLEDNRYASEPTEDGLYRLTFNEYTLLADTARISSATRILSVFFEEVPEAENTAADIRGLRPGDPVEKVLAAWPNDNESLAGTREEAVLYQTGSLPGQASAGVMKRNGQRAESILYTLYQMTTNGVSLSKVTYTLTAGYVDTIEVSFDDELLTLADAQAEMAAILDLQATTEFSAFLSNGESMEAEPFNRDDLLFSSVDFLSVTPDDLIALLGDEYAETWSPDDDGRQIRVMEWHAMAATFVCDQDGSAISVDNIMIDEDLLIGPRGLTIGDTLDVILGRFHYGAAEADGMHTWLYGSEAADDYAVMDSLYPGQAELHYVTTVDGQKVEMILYVNEGALRSITLQMI